MTMHAPDTQSTSDGPSGAPAAGNIRLINLLFGRMRVKKDVRPISPEKKLNSLRAENWRLPSASIIRGPVMPTLGFSAKNFSMRSKKSRSTKVSGLIRTTYLPVVLRIPLLQARAKPRLVGFWIRVTSLDSSGFSSESLSTITVSKFVYPVLRSESIHRSVSGHES